MTAHERILALVASLPGPACAADIYAADRSGVFESEADAASKLSSSYTAGWLTREKRPNPKAGKNGARKEVFFYAAGVKPVVQEEADDDFDADASCCPDADHYGAWLRINDEIEAWQTVGDKWGIKTPEQLDKLLHSQDSKLHAMQLEQEDEEDDDTPPPADAALLASANRAMNERLGDIAVAIGHPGGNDGQLVGQVIALAEERDDLERKLADAIQGREADQALIAELSRKVIMAKTERDDLIADQDATVGRNTPHHSADPTDRAHQVGGDHYAKLAVQPWDVMRATFTPVEFQAFLRGNVIKYLMRDKGGAGGWRLEDHQKARHYLATLIAEMEAA